MPVEIQLRKAVKPDEAADWFFEARQGLDSVEVWLTADGRAWTCEASFRLSGTRIPEFCRTVHTAVLARYHGSDGTKVTDRDELVALYSLLVFLQS